MTERIAIVVGFIGKLPLAGMALYNLHYIAGLQELGYRIHYVERLNHSNECYHPEAGKMTDNPDYALRFLANVLATYGITNGSWSFIDRQNQCHGAGWQDLSSALDEAEFVLTLADPTWFDELERCPRRAFIDGDPMFTQSKMLDGGLDETLSHYPVLFTYSTRIGAPDCAVPSAGRRWLPARPVVATRSWTASPARAGRPITTLMNWSSGSDVYIGGQVYGYKDRSFKPFFALPRRTDQPLAVAVGGAAPRDKLREQGWEVINPLRVSLEIDTYKKFIADSGADLGIAKHAYVASRCGWFSDRSTCYLGAGRPVLHQDTGFGDWLPTGEGVLSFTTVEDVLEGLDQLQTNYRLHARAARAIAEEHFEARTVVAQMLDAAEFS